jgi:hypothetical protein
VAARSRFNYGSQALVRRRNVIDLRVNATVCLSLVLMNSFQNTSAERPHDGQRHVEEQV